MADDPETPAPDSPPARGGGIMGTIRAALRHPQAHLVVWGVAAIGVFLLIRRFGQSGAAQVAAATDATATDATAAGIPDPALSASSPFDPGAFGDVGAAGASPSGSIGSWIGSLASGSGGSGGGTGNTTTASGGSGSLFGGLTSVVKSVLGSVTAAANATPAQIVPAAGGVPIGRGVGSAINNPLAAAQRAHRGLAPVPHSVVNPNYFAPGAIAHAASVAPVPHSVVNPNYFAPGTVTSPMPAAHPAQANHPAPPVLSHPVAPPISSTVNHYTLHARGG